MAIAVTVLVTPGPAVTIATARPRKLRMGMGHVDGRALVAHVDDADPEPGAMVPDRLDMPALQAEDAVDAARLQEAGDPGGDRPGIGVEVLARGGGGVL